MITNDVQYRTARAQVDRLERLLQAVQKRQLADNEAQLRQRLEMDAVEGQVTELRGQLEEYDDLRAGRVPVGTLSAVDDLPRLLVRARIAAGLSQRELAERLGLKEQQIQRYEATAYASASLSRLREVADALGLEGHGLPEAMPTIRAVIKRLTDLGLDAGFVRRRIAPAALRDAESHKDEMGSLIDLASRIGRVFGWATGDLLSGRHLEADRTVLAATAFKLPKTTAVEMVAAYTVYSHYLALVTLQATQGIERRPLSADAAAFRAEWMSQGSLGKFEGLLRFAWDHGVPVVPLADSGMFHAAAWRVGGREIIVLKQGNRSASRWTFDLLHEIGHIVGDLRDRDGSVIDVENAVSDAGEEQANQFAGDVLLDGRAEQLVARCVGEASGSVEKLKRVVPRVAAAEKVDVGALSNYLAFRLSMQNINWWGTASNLQPDGPDPWRICRDVLLARANLGALNPLDRDLLTQALAA